MELSKEEIQLRNRVCDVAGYLSEDVLEALELPVYYTSDEALLEKVVGDIEDDFMEYCRDMVESEYPGEVIRTPIGDLSIHLIIEEHRREQSIDWRVSLSDYRSHRLSCILENDEAEEYIAPYYGYFYPPRTPDQVERWDALFKLIEAVIRDYPSLTSNDLETIVHALIEPPHRCRVGGSLATIVHALIDPRNSPEIHRLAKVVRGDASDE